MAAPWLWSRARLFLGRMSLLTGAFAWLAGTPVMLVARASGDACTTRHVPGWVTLVECGVGGPLLVAVGMALVGSRRGVRVWAVLAAVTFLGLGLTGIVGQDRDTGVTTVGAVGRTSC